MSKPGMIDAFGLSKNGESRAREHFLISKLTPSLLVEHASLRLADRSHLFGNSRGRLLMVAEGMGPDTGDTASTVAINFAMNYVLNTMPWYFRLGVDGDDLRDDLKGALRRAQDAVQTLSSGDPTRAEMASTLTMAYTLWPRLYVVHAGDSECYLQRGSTLESITRPTSGRGREDLLGAGAEGLAARAYRIDLVIGDAFLLCTRSVSQLPDDTIREVLLRSTDAETACRALVEFAKERSPADATAVVAYIRSADDVSVPARVRSGGKPLTQTV